jgi:poly(3-hydroxybutyrate) depolymerase
MRSVKYIAGGVLLAVSLLSFSHEADAIRPRRSVTTRAGSSRLPFEPLTLSGSTWPTGSNARYDWAFNARTNGTTHATILLDVGMPPTNLPQAGLLLGRDTSGAQRHMQITINTTGGMVVAASPAVATAYSTCTTAAGTFPVSARTRAVVRYEGPATTNAGRIRVWTSSVTAAGFTLPMVERSCTFAGTIPGAWSNDVTTAPWSVGQQFNGTLPLRSATLYSIALWSGIAADPTDVVPEVMAARNLSSTSLGAPTLNYTFNAATVTETIFQGAGGLTGTSPTLRNSQAIRNNPAVTTLPGCGQAANSATATISETFQFAVTSTITNSPRAMLVVTPGNYSSSTRYPVVLIAHGCSYTTASLRTDELAASGFGIEGLGRSRAIYVYLQGLGGPRGYPIECPTNSDTGWSSAQFVNNPDLVFTQRALDSLDHRFCIDRSRVYLYGRSMGGSFVNFLAQYRPQLWRATGTLVSVYYNGTAHAGPHPNIQTGNAGDTVAFDGVRPTVLNARDAWITANGCSTFTADPTYSECVRYSCTQAQLDFCLSNPNTSHTPSVQSRSAVRDFFLRQGI